MIILLGLQIFRVANQLINGSTNVPPFPIYANSVQIHKILNNPLNNTNDLNGNKPKVYMEMNTDFYKNLDNISKRYNELKTSVNSNEGSENSDQISKHSKHKNIPKPHSFPQRVESPKYPNNYMNSESDVESDDMNDSELYSEPKSESELYSNPKSEESEEDNSNPKDNKYVVDYNELEDFKDFDINDEFDAENEDRNEDTDYKYKEEETPDCASGHSYCFYDDKYPQKRIQKSMDKQMDILTQIMPESSETFDLVEGIPKEKDENYTYHENDEHLMNDDENGGEKTDDNEIKYKNGGYICPSLVDYVQPKRAQNNEGLWKVILNLNESYRGIDLKQHIRVEECLYEAIKCSFTPNYYKSECIQKYSNERLLAWTPDKGIHLDVFRLPIACSCHLTPNL